MLILAISPMASFSTSVRSMSPSSAFRESDPSSVSILLAERAKIAPDKILVDPGVGFAKSYEQNLCAIRQVGELRELGYPVLLGTSRKSVIGLTLDLPANQRVEGTLATTVIGVTQGCSFVRVHDVAENVRAIAMTEAVLYARK